MTHTSKHARTRDVNARALDPLDEHDISESISHTLAALDSAQACGLTYDPAVDHLSMAALRMARHRDRARCIIDLRQPLDLERAS